MRCLRKSGHNILAFSHKCFYNAWQYALNPPRPERRKIMENTCIAIWRVHSFSIVNGSYLGSIALR